MGRIDANVSDEKNAQPDMCQFHDHGDHTSHRLMDDTCAICLEEVESGSAHTLDCEHVFHAECIIGWLRRGNLSCPSCRTDLHDNTQHIPAMAIRERARYLRVIARRKNAPMELKRLVEKVRAAENKERERCREAAQYDRLHREVMKASRRLRGMRWMARHRVYCLKRLLGIFECEGFPLPALSVNV